MKLARFAFAAMFAVSAFAQSDRGAITGTVVDPGELVVSECRGHGSERRARNPIQRCNHEHLGNYTLNSLPAGPYSVSVESPGFKKFTQTNVLVGGCFQRARRFHSTNRHRVGIRDHHRRSALAENGKDAGDSHTLTGKERLGQFAD